MDRYSHQHLRCLTVLLIGIPVSILLINVAYMQRFLVSKIQLDEVPLNARLAKEVVRLRWINSAHAKELREVKSKFKDIRVTGTEKPAISVTFFAKYAYKRMKVLRNIVRCLGSILDHSKADLHFHVLLDSPSKMRITRTLFKLMTDKRKFKVSYHFLEPIFAQFDDVIKLFRHYFFTKDVGRYNDDIFFVSQIFHKIRPFKPLDKLIMLDLDTKFRADITKLWSEFDAFKEKQVLAMAYDQQPQYRYDFALYRSKNPKSDVGGPHPGRQGFNTGVVLFDLKRMRDSKLYNELLKETAISSLCEKFEFRGYMGHQDFYTLTLMEHPELYRVLNCSWNRQLDTGWKKNSGLKIFNQYHSCPGAVHIYHGNGEAFIPDS